MVYKNALIKKDKIINYFSVIKKNVIYIFSNIKSSTIFTKLKQALKPVLNKLFFLFIPFIKIAYNKIISVINNNQELQKRIKYGLIFACLLLLTLLCGGIVYIFSVFAIFCIMSYELLKMVANIEQSNNKMFIYLRGFGLIYIAVCCLSFILIRENQQGLRVSLWMFLTVWSVDVFAYIFGKKFGKIPLAPEISPKKTYEGAILGSICAMFISMALYRLLATHSQNSLSILSFFLFSIIVIILAQLSDLSESYIKRQCCVKDSGNILPGHGGLLDRFDSFLIVAPFIFIIVWLNDGILF